MAVWLLELPSRVMKPSSRLLIHAHGLGGSQILGYQNAGFGALQGGIVHPLQDVQDGLCNVDDIRTAGLQIRVIHGSEHRSLIVACRLDGVLGALLLPVDDLLDGVHKVVIIQHHGVDVEHLGDVLAGLCQCLFIQGGLLLNGLGPGLFKACFLCRRVRDLGGGNRGIFFLVDLQLANGDAIEHAFAGAYLHRSLSFVENLVRKSPRRVSRKGFVRRFKDQTFSVRNF